MPSTRAIVIRCFWDNFKLVGGCSIWQGSLDDGGYGRVSGLISRICGTVYVHRIVYLLAKGWIGGSHVLHSCDTPSCGLPSHLFLGSQKANMEDASIKGRLLGRIPGEKNGRSKLTAEIVVKIRRSNRTNIWWGKRIGVENATISKARRRETWRHVG